MFFSNRESPATPWCYRSIRAGSSTAGDSTKRDLPTDINDGVRNRNIRSEIPRENDETRPGGEGTFARPNARKATPCGERAPARRRNVLIIISAVERARGNFPSANLIYTARAKTRTRAHTHAGPLTCLIMKNFPRENRRSRFNN